MNREVTKRFVWVEPEERASCLAEVRIQSGSYGEYDTSTDVCGKPAAYGVDIHTTAINGRRYINRVRYCANLSPLS